MALGPSGAADVHRYSGMPRNKAYESLERLVSRGVIEVQHGRPSALQGQRGEERHREPHRQLRARSEGGPQGPRGEAGGGQRRAPRAAGRDHLRVDGQGRAGGQEAPGGAHLRSERGRLRDRRLPPEVPALSEDRAQGRVEEGRDREAHLDDKARLRTSPRSRTRTSRSSSSGRSSRPPPSGSGYSHTTTR